MSTAEIADNKWEVQASKPPVATIGGLMQLLMISGFAGLFGYLTVMSIIGAITPKPEANHIEKGFGQGGASPTAAPAAK